MIQHNLELDLTFLNHLIPATIDDGDMAIVTLLAQKPGLTKHQVAKHFEDLSLFQVFNWLTSCVAKKEIYVVDGCYYLLDLDTIQQ